MRSIVIATRHPRLRFDRRALVAAVRTLDTHAATIRVLHPAFLAGELSVVFLTDTALAQLHGTFLDDPTPTDVITFEGEPALGAAGEICVSADAALRQRDCPPTKAGREIFSAEVMLYVIHGWLHLAGYDDLVRHSKRAMRRAECRALDVLRRTQRLPSFRLNG